MRSQPVSPDDRQRDGGQRDESKSSFHLNFGGPKIFEKKLNQAPENLKKKLNTKVLKKPQQNTAS